MPVQYQSRKSLAGISPEDAQRFGLLITLYAADHSRVSQVCIYDTEDVRKTVKDYIKRQFPELKSRQGAKLYNSQSDGTVLVCGTGCYLTLVLRQTPYYPR